MKRQHILFFLTLLLTCAAKAQQNPSAIYVDKSGVMRWTDTRKEASFFGVNYTLPFAHAYRAMGYLGVDRKAAIDRDVYHFARLGINAYRIHIWDVEISDAQGNLLENDHLDLLDYLIGRLKERGIRTLITAQTNFGNGYPERNQPTGGYSYNYEKCTMHSHPEAIAAQERYIAALVNHVNPYTEKAYKDDPFIVGFEINNEPCHAGTVEETKAYINRMLTALKQAGNHKPVFYNVSHNQQVVEAYYATEIQGTTYQWYPIGLVSGHTRKGNFLPFADAYRIPFSHLKGFDKKARLVYEFDPADILYSYMYPATVRTFRTAGFQWITQFAYDPIDMGAYNSEYQTHYLNVAYTPNKAIGLMIAAETAQTVKRGESFGSYPADTLFKSIRVSHSQDLSELNEDVKFYYSNNTDTRPLNASRLQSIAGCGSSPIVRYEGTGVYWIDRLEPGVWRLEVMPDVVQVSDPFAKPSLQNEVMRIVPSAWNMTLDLPDLGPSFAITGLNAGNTCLMKAEGGMIAALHPGVYLLKREGVTARQHWETATRWKNITLGEYCAPKTSDESGFSVIHQPAAVVDAEKELRIEAEIAGSSLPDSVIIYTDKASFWNEKNRYYKMNRIQGNRYQVVIPASDVREGRFNYTMVVCQGQIEQTFPSKMMKSPLHWEYTATAFYETVVIARQQPVALFETTSDFETYTLPEWGRTERQFVTNKPTEKPTLRVTFESKDAQPVFFLQQYIKDTVSGRIDRLKQCTTLCLHLKQIPTQLKVGFITSDGYTYLADCPVADQDGIVRIPLTSLMQTKTALLPPAYPVFLDKYFCPSVAIPFQVEKIDKLELCCEGAAGVAMEIEVGSIWME